MHEPTSVEYDIIPAPTSPTRVRETPETPGDAPVATTREAVEAAIQKLAKRADALKMIRRALAEARRRQAAGPAQAKKKARNRARNKAASASRKRNRGR